jgi:clan AA aspartic protease (TIGR02281 family)
MKVIFLSLFILLVVFTSAGDGEVYKWVDEKGTIHFADDLSNIPENYRTDVETMTPPKELPSSGMREKPASPSAPKAPGVEAVEVNLLRRHELLLVEVLLNNKVARNFIVDSGASFTLISRQTANELGLTIDDETPIIPVSTVNDVILTPLVTLRSLRVGNAEVENVEALVYTMPSDKQGLLGNSFLNKFKVVLDSINAKMTLYPLKGEPSPDRPGGYGRDYWVGQFRFYLRNLMELKKVKTNYESRGVRSELNRVNNGIRYFENQLVELDRRASFAGVPRNWRE